NATEVGLIEKDSSITVTTVTIVSVASADFVESTADLAVTVIVAGSGTVAGAVYFPVASIVPQLAPEQPGPATLQVALWLAPLPGACPPTGLTSATNRQMPPI